jgi:hypothetical protein
MTLKDAAAFGDLLGPSIIGIPPGKSPQDNPLGEKSGKYI